jgi:hypothetical protein
VTVAIEKAHAALGASGAKRWMACPGSVRLSEGQPTFESEHARIGTVAHTLAETCLRSGTTPFQFVDMEIDGIRIDEDMAEGVAVFVEYCRPLMQYQHGIEHRFSLAALAPPSPMFGTSDFWAYIPEEKILVVPDYKNGSGVVVDVVNNPQLMYYGLGAALTANVGPIETVRLVIVQPRAGHPDGAVRSWDVDYEELLAFGVNLLEAAKATLQPNAPLNTGDHCRWCRAAPICPAQHAQAQSIAQIEFSAVPMSLPPAPDTLPPMLLEDILTKLPVLEDWAKQVRAYAQHKLESGEVVRGFKLVAKRANRKWTSEKDVAAWADQAGVSDEELFDKKLRSPAQIEKVVGKKLMPVELITQQSSGYTMAPEADARPALTPSAADEFTALPAATSE